MDWVPPDYALHDALAIAAHALLNPKYAADTANHPAIRWAEKELADRARWGAQRQRHLFEGGKR